MTKLSKFKNFGGLFGLLFKVDRVKINSEADESTAHQSSQGLFGFQVSRESSKINKKNK